MKGKEDSRAISYRVLLHIAWRNLISKKLRTFLTIFGVIIGIGAIFFLLSFGLGLRNLVTDQVIGDQSIKSIDVSTSNSKIITLDVAAVNKINNFPHVEDVGKLYSYPGTISYRGSENDAVTYGVDKAYQELSNLDLVAGRHLENTDTDKVLVNRATLDTIGITDAKSALGVKLKITVPLKPDDADITELSNDFEVVGVLGTGSGSEIFIPLGLFEGAGVRHYSQIKVVVDDTLNVPTLRRQIEGLGFQTTSPIDTLDEINRVFQFFTIILVGFGAIGMIVSVLGMFNTLTISLLERTKEIGLMMALGARNRDMRKLFIFEAVLLSFSGAIIGILFAICAGFIVNIFMNQMASGRGVTENFSLFSTPLWAIASLILFMVSVGLLVVYFPARRAQRINPIEALRRE